MLIALTWFLASAAPPPSGSVWVGGGSYVPLYPSDKDIPAVSVEGFWMQKLPVTKRDYLTFLVQNPAWRRDTVKTLFADEGYLRSWTTQTQPDGSLDQPMVEVSWFAARAYCEAQDLRLPTEDEWELAASADETRVNARSDPAFTARLLAWYGSTERTLPNVGSKPANFWGVHDLHGGVWEWVEDFNNTLYGADNRQSGDEDTLRFCGAGALSAADAKDYATFMRVAFRTSLQARYTTKNLGFRCVRDGVAP